MKTLVKREREREMIKLLLSIKLIFLIIIISFFSSDFCSSSYNQCFGGWWEDDPLTETDRPGLANGELSQKLRASQSSPVEEVSEVKIGTENLTMLTPDHADIPGSPNTKLL